MPYRPKTPCHHPGCPELVEAGRLYCEKHLPLHPEVTRPAAKRGYNRRWQKVRKSYLEAHPLCVQCAKQGKYVRATVVDHIIPHRGDQKLFWDQNNWQSLCKSCHDKKTLTEDINPTYTYCPPAGGRGHFSTVKSHGDRWPLFCEKPQNS